jgi:single-stranded-DNA-specific exonuclease
MNSLLKKSWKIKTPLTDIPLLERITAHREVKLDEELSELHSPWSMKGMSKAVERIERAIQDQERIMIFGDYDVDGVCGATILYLGLKELGANVSVRLPHREKDGYGLNTKVLDECLELGVTVVITVDCGISNVKQVEYGKERGLDIIVTDHHSIPAKLPDAYAILNPKQVDCEYPEKDIVGSVVGYKLICALNLSLRGTKQSVLGEIASSAALPRNNNHDLAMTDLLDLAALATVADCAPLKGENRLIVKQGLLQFAQTKHRGLRKLAESFNLVQIPVNSQLSLVTSYDLGFKIAPCINAAGRLEDPMIAFQMMLGDEEKAMELRTMNQERQEIVKTAIEEALDIVETKHAHDSILVIHAEHWQPGIIGLLAGKLCERYHRPVICLTKHEQKYVGSCRSIPEINIIERLQEHADLFLNFGGHAQAAGLSIEPTKLGELRQKMMTSIDEFLKTHPITPYISIDTEVISSEITLGNVQALARLEPFGMGNPKPKFLLRNIRIDQSRPVGGDKTHLQLTLRHGEKFFKGIAFQMAEHEAQLQLWKHIDIICQLNKNEFNGKITVDLQMIDARAHHKSPL